MEQLYGTEATLWRETAPLSGVAAGDVSRFPVRSIGFERDIHERSRRTDLFRHQSRAIPLHESYRVRSTHDLTLDLFGFLMSGMTAATPGGAGFRDLSREAAVPSFRAEFETTGGRRFAFDGLTPVEIELNLRGRRAGELSISWVAARRREDDDPAAVETSLSARLAPSRLASVQLLDTDPETDPLLSANDTTAFGLDVFFRRDTQVTQFGPDGIPRRLRSAPLRIVAAIDLPPSAVTADAKSRWDGAVAFVLRDGQESLDLRLPVAAGFCSTDEPVGYDFATETLMLETSPDETATPARYRIS